ncbi:hypothetical protein TNCV_2598331 [Trichonephila clavipes]|nr:hypothetical protein TNCV_2598331 [Trichonephila clavipes]
MLRYASAHCPAPGIMAWGGTGFHCRTPSSTYYSYTKQPALSPIENVWHNDWPGIHHPLQHQINFGNMWKPHGLLYPKDTSKVSLILCRGVWQQLYPTMAATLTTDIVSIHTSQKAVILIV